MVVDPIQLRDTGLTILLCSSRALNKISGAILRASRGRFVQPCKVSGDNRADIWCWFPPVRDSRSDAFPEPCPRRPWSLTAQDCLTKNGYNETKCAKLVDALYDCCQAFYERNGSDAKSVSCPKPDLLRLKIEQRRKGI